MTFYLPRPRLQRVTGLHGRISSLLKRCLTRVTKQRVAGLCCHISSPPRTCLTKVTRRCFSSQVAARQPLSLYEFIDRVEPLWGYQCGEYHPVYIDDRLNGRYRIVYKLGWGSYSTVWLALDEETNRYVSVKVGTTDSDHSESRILSELNRRLQRPRGDSSHGLPLIPTLLDCFDIHGPNGTHPCMVTPPARCSVGDVKDECWNWFFQLDVARSLAAQAVMAVAFLHSQGYAHGDLQNKNFLLEMPLPFDGLSVEELYGRYGKPEKITYLCPDDYPKPPTHPGVPTYATPCVWLGKAPENFVLTEANLVLSDLSNAFRPVEKSRFKSAALPCMEPPETFFEPEAALTLASDIWSLGCSIYGLLSFDSLFRDPCWSDYPRSGLIRQQMSILGPLPPEWAPKWEARLANELNQQEDSREEVPNPRSWEQAIDVWIQTQRQEWQMETMSTEELDALRGLLRRMLAWRPSHRPDINEVLETEWMTKWALPAYRRRFDAVKRCS